MARSKAAATVASVAPLYRKVRAVLDAARTGAYRAVNRAMVEAYWHVGRLIVVHEQKGLRRAAYGEAVLEDLSRRLPRDFGRGFDVTNLRKMRQFSRMFEIRDALRLESGRKPGKQDAVHLASADRPVIRHDLSWSHYRRLMQVEDPRARDW